MKITRKTMEQGLYKNKYRTDSIRLKGWDYTRNGMYFVTICTNYNGNIFGKIEKGKMVLNNLGEIAKKHLYEIPDHFPHATLDACIVMPDHVHAVIIIDKHVETCHGTSLRIDKMFDVETHHGVSLPKDKDNIVEACHGMPLLQIKRPLKGSLSMIVNQYKGAVKRYCNKNKIPFSWQRKFYDRIIWNEYKLDFVRNYIIDNPLKCNDRDFYKEYFRL